MKGLALFLLAFLLLYGGLHAYVFYKVQVALRLPTLAGVCLVLALGLLYLAPLLVRAAEKGGFETLARLLSQVGYGWMGILFLFCAAAVCIDLYRFLISVAGMALKQPVAGLLPSPRLALWLPLILAVTAAIYGYGEAMRVRTEHLILKTEKLPEGINRLRIVQISDLHVGLIVRERLLDAMAAAVRAEEPDILISTGDLVDGQLDHILPAVERLRSLPARHGKFAITGNHEFYAGLDDAEAFTRGSGFRMLRDEAILAAGAIRLVGIDDLPGHGFARPSDVTERSLLQASDPGRFTLLLKHKPLVERDSAGLFDLQLSGHTHGGQLFPFSLITGLFFPFHAGLYQVPGGGMLYVSRGTGTWGPPLRLGAPPEITVIDLVRSAPPTSPTIPDETAGIRTGAGRHLGP